MNESTRKMAKKATAWALTAFVVVGIGVASLRALMTEPPGDAADAGQVVTTADRLTQEGYDPGNVVLVLNLHGAEHCETCENMEAFALSTIESHFADAVERKELAHFSIDYSLPETKHYVERHKVTVPMPAVAVEIYRDGELADARRLDQVLDYLMPTDEAGCVEYLKEEIGAAMDGGAS